MIADNLWAHESQPVKALLDRAQKASPALHADLLIVAQPSGAVFSQISRVARLP